MTIVYFWNSRTFQDLDLPPDLLKQTGSSQRLGNYKEYEEQEEKYTKYPSIVDIQGPRIHIEQSSIGSISTGSRCKRRRKAMIILVVHLYVCKCVMRTNDLADFVDSNAIIFTFY